MMDIKEIQKFLPHRYPFLQVDRIIEMEPGAKAVGIKNVTINEGFFQGHFPGQPIMPGVLIIEAMAQVAGILAFRSGGNIGQIRLFYEYREGEVQKTCCPG